jgi:hypothetical protein
MRADQVSLENVDSTVPMSSRPKAQILRSEDSGPLARSKSSPLIDRPAQYTS